MSGLLKTRNHCKRLFTGKSIKVINESPYISLARAKVNDETFDIGTWSAVERGEVRKIVFKPLKPIARSDEGILVWLGNEISKIGEGSISEEGEVTVILPINVRYVRLLGQVSWVYYTLLKEGNQL